jgi:hypothetical protein
MMLDGLRRWLRKYFSFEVQVDELEPSSSLKAPCKPLTRHKPRKRVKRVVPPSERFVWAMVVLIVSLVGLVAIEITIVVVTGAVNDVILFVVSGFIGALSSRFLEAKK